MSQSRTMSLVEAGTNVQVGFWIAVLTHIVVFPWFGLTSIQSSRSTVGRRSGRSRQSRGRPPYPVVCSPQAGAAAAPLALRQASLGLSFAPQVRRVAFARPTLPASSRKSS